MFYHGFADFAGPETSETTHVFTMHDSLAVVYARPSFYSRPCCGVDLSGSQQGDLKARVLWRMDDS